MVGAAGFFKMKTILYLDKQIKLEMKPFLVQQNSKHPKLNLNQHKQQILELRISNIYSRENFERRIRYGE